MGALAGVAQLVGVSSHNPKGHGLDSQSGHMPGLQVQSPVRMSTGGSTRMSVSLLHKCFSPSLPLPSPFSKINEHVLG